MGNDGGIIALKHEVLYQVAKLAFEGKLESDRDTLPEKIIPGMIPHYRCADQIGRASCRERV